MSDITNLERAVAAAREAYARASEQHARSRRHAMSLIGIVETQLREKRIALAQNEAERAGMTREYGQLRQMLHALVMTVEVGEGDRLWGAPAELVDGPDAGARAGPLAVATGPSDAGPEGNGADRADDLRAGLQRMLKNKRAQLAKARKPEAREPAVGEPAVGEPGAPAE
jgi:hypothetical protein